IKEPGYTLALLDVRVEDLLDDNFGRMPLPIGVNGCRYPGLNVAFNVERLQLEAFASSCSSPKSKRSGKL
ncbi:hypothetical protein HDU96_001687, partial [Phlyctochytrium bullatum]